MNKKYAIEVQSELKTIVSQLPKVGDAHLDWGIELTDENKIEPGHWLESGGVWCETISTEPNGGSSILKSFIYMSDLRYLDNGVAEVTITVDLPEKYNLPVKSFSCEYEHLKSKPVRGFPDAMYEAYLYMSKVNEFTYAEKLTYLTVGLWLFWPGRSLIFGLSLEQLVTTFDEEFSENIMQDIVS
ncbi:TPA: hypothetical protein ACPJ00_003091 [Vibrio diabolicus]